MSSPQKSASAAMSPKRLLLTLLKALLVLFVLAAVFTPLLARQQDILGKPAPDFALSDLDGNPVELEKLKGKVVVLDFWAVWCGPCQDSVPFFQTLQDKYGDDLVVVGVHVNDRVPPVDKVKTYLADKDVSYANVISTTAVDDAFIIFAMPTTYIIDREGKVAKRHVGFNPSKTPKSLEEDLREVLGVD